MFEFTEEQRMFQKAKKEFVEEEVAPLVDEAERNETTPIELFRKMGELGYLCPGYPPSTVEEGLGKLVIVL